MSRLYTVSASFTWTNTGGDADLLEIVPTTGKPCRLVALYLGQNTEFGDTAEESVRISIIRLPATFTSSNGTSTTPRTPDDVEATVGFTAETNGATVATTSGTAETIYELSWNVRAPMEWRWDRAEAATVRPSAGLVVRGNQTPVDDIGVQLSAIIEED